MDCFWRFFPPLNYWLPLGVGSICVGELPFIRGLDQTNHQVFHTDVKWGNDEKHETSCRPRWDPMLSKGTVMLQSQLVAHFPMVRVSAPVGASQ